MQCGCGSINLNPLDATPQKREGPNDHQTAPPVEHLTSIHPTEDSEGEEEEEEGDTPEEGEDTPEEEGDTPTLVDTPTLFNMPSNNTPSFFVTERQVSEYSILPACCCNLFSFEF